MLKIMLVFEKYAHFSKIMHPNYYFKFGKNT